MREEKREDERERERERERGGGGRRGEGEGEEGMEERRETTSFDLAWSSAAMIYL